MKHQPSMGGYMWIVVLISVQRERAGVCLVLHVPLQNLTGHSSAYSVWKTARTEPAVARSGDAYKLEG